MTIDCSITVGKGGAGKSSRFRSVVFGRFAIRKLFKARGARDGRRFPRVRSIFGKIEYYASQQVSTNAGFDLIFIGAGDLCHVVVVDSSFVATSDHKECDDGADAKNCDSQPRNRFGVRKKIVKHQPLKARKVTESYIREGLSQ